MPAAAGPATKGAGTATPGTGTAAGPASRSLRPAFAVLPLTRPGGALPVPVLGAAGALTGPLGAVTAGPGAAEADAGVAVVPNELVADDAAPVGAVPGIGPLADGALVAIETGTPKSSTSSVPNPSEPKDTSSAPPPLPSALDGRTTPE